MENSSKIKVFTLSELNETRTNHYAYFTMTLSAYVLILSFNLTLIFTIALEKALHGPMYIFLCNLCANGLYGSAAFFPKFLSDILSGSHVISYQGCFLQVFVIYSSVQCDFATLTVMAYDRYVAICKPLMYHSIMTGQMVCKLIIFCWMFPFFSMSVAVMLSSRLQLCGSHIDKLYCENWSIVKLSCEATVTNNVSGFITIFIFVGFVVFVIFSYIKLIVACTKSKEDRVRFMQTCLPHLFALINLTTVIFFDLMYARYGSKDMSQGLRNFLALQFLITPPIFNPVIYGLKLTEVRKKLQKQFSEWF